jgi:signal transduction histidine kinase
LLSYVSIVVFVLVILEIPLGISFGRREVNDLISSVERDAFVLASLGEDQLEHGSGLDIATTAQSYTDRTGGRVVIVDEQGLAVVDTEGTGTPSRSFASRPEMQQALSGSVSAGTRYSETLQTRIAYAAVPVASGGIVHGAVRVTYPTSAVDSRVRQIWLMLAAIAVVTVLAAVVVAVWLARSVASPLRHLQLASAGLGAGDLTVRASVEAGPPEVRALALGFNQMASRLEELVTAQEIFVADASHELRSPLAALRLRLENLARDASDEGRARLEAAIEEVARLSRLVDGLLTLARAERTAIGVPTTPIDVGPILEARCEAWAPLAAERNVEVRVEQSKSAENIRAFATSDRLTQVLDNLIANALEASPSGAVITLCATRPAGSTDDALVDIHVEDEGAGLDPEQRLHAFDRFWRAERRRTKASGSGLGLSIVQKLVAADGGAVELREAAGGGVDAVVRLRATSTS